MAPGMSSPRVTAGQVARFRMVFGSECLDVVKEFGPDFVLAAINETERPWPSDEQEKN